MKNLKFSDVAKFINDKVELSNLQNEQYISTENMLPNYGGIVEIDKLPKIEKCNKFKQGDILFSNIRTYFKKVWVAEFSGGCSPDVLIIRSKDESIVRTSYLYLLICSDDFINFTVASSNGAKMPRGDKNAIKNYIFNIPDIAFQDKAINTYFRFKKKITLNTQTNQTLEQIAQAIFKHWFIDFAPVHTKANALAAGTSPEQAELATMASLSGKTLAEITALQHTSPKAYHQLQQTARAFPSEFVESEMGLMPKGWEVENIGNIADVIKGKSYKSNELTNSTTALVTLKSFNRGGGYRIDGLKEYSGKYKPEQEVYAGELIIAYTDVTQAADIIGKPAMVMSNNNYEHLVISLDVAVVRPKNQYLKYFLYCLAMTERFQQHTKSFCSGTTVLHLGKNAVPSFQFAMPNQTLLIDLDKKLRSIFEKINLNIQENESLTKTRDELLPRLLSGEIEL